jgi:hypothetical protein
VTPVKLQLELQWQLLLRRVPPKPLKPLARLLSRRLVRR